MSGHVHRRHPARPVLAAVLACVLVWLGVAAATSVGSIPQIVHAGAEAVATQPSLQHVAQRIAARLGHVRAAVVAASQRDLPGAAVLRVLAIVLAMLLGLGVARRVARRHPVVRMHGVRAPPAGTHDRALAARATSHAPLITA